VPWLDGNILLITARGCGLYGRGCSKRPLNTVFRSGQGSAHRFPDVTSPWLATCIIDLVTLQRLSWVVRIDLYRVKTVKNSDFSHRWLATSPVSGPDPSGIIDFRLAVRDFPGHRRAGRACDVAPAAAVYGVPGRAGPCNPGPVHWNAPLDRYTGRGTGLPPQTGRPWLPPRLTWQGGNRCLF